MIKITGLNVEFLDYFTKLKEENQGNKLKFGKVMQSIGIKTNFVKNLYSNYKKSLDKTDRICQLVCVNFILAIFLFQLFQSYNVRKIPIS